MRPNFYTDILCQDPAFSSPDRCHALALLEPETRVRVLAVIDDAREHGIVLMVWETFRSRVRQQMLFDRGATKLREVGVHHYGLAIDLVKAVGTDPSWKGSFDFLGPLARTHGLVWGGDWGAPESPHSFVDPVHFQRCTVGRQASLFRGEWWPDTDYDPYRDGAR